MTAPTIPTPLDALFLALREVIAPALAAAAALEAEHASRGPDEWAAAMDFGGNQDDAYEAGVIEGRTRGAGSLAADVAALLDAAARPGADSEEVPR